MTTFFSARAAITLRKLAENPFDLTASGALTSDRMKQFHTYGSRLHLFYATERITTPVLEALFELALEKNAIGKMRDMQSGLKVNCTEDRAVLHTAIRDLSSPASKSPKTQEAITLAKQELEKLKLFLQEIDRENLFTDVVQIGIGGSCLGPKCISHALQYTAKGRRQAHFLSNIDPDATAKLLTKINPATTLFIAVSKSGTTMETLTNVYFVSEHLKKCGVNPKNHLISVTEKGSPMDDPQKYRSSFYIWDYIGGRYSVSSMVGAVIISSVTGIDTFMEFLQGAHSMDITALKEDPFYNLPLLSALLNIWNRNFLGFLLKLFFPIRKGCSICQHIYNNAIWNRTGNELIVRVIKFSLPQDLSFGEKWEPMDNTPFISCFIKVRMLFPVNLSVLKIPNIIWIYNFREQAPKTNYFLIY